jgi:hypothetical protein
MNIPENRRQKKIGAEKNRRKKKPAVEKIDG